MGDISFGINTTDNKHKLKALFSVINNSTILEIMECVKISGKGNRVFLTSCDLINFVTYSIDLYEGPDFEFCLYHRKLRAFIANSPDPNISFTLNDKERKVLIESGGIRYNTPFLRADDYPKYDNYGVQGDNRVLLDFYKAGPAMKKALTFVSNDDLRPNLGGVLLTDFKDHIYAIATDAHWLFYYPLMKTPECFKGKSLILDKKGCSLLLQMFGKDQVEMHFDDKRACFTSGTKRLTTTFIYGKPIPFQSVLADYDLCFYVQRKRLLAFLILAEPFAFINNELGITVCANSVKVFSQNIDDDAEMNYNLSIHNTSRAFEEFTFFLNNVMFRKAIVLNNDEYVKINHSTHPKEAVIVDDMILIMPINKNSVI